MDNDTNLAAGIIQESYFRPNPKRGKDLDKLKVVSRTLVAGEPLEAHFWDHPLVGNYEGRRE